MNILMMTNTFTPHVGGVARSVAAFTNEYRALGNRVVVVAPEFEGTPPDETDVVRMPAIQKFNGSDFSVALPIPGRIESRLTDFQPDIVHSHHPFLLGGTAVRIASQLNVPLIFTHHTMYEQYTHYVPGDSEPMKEFAINLSTGYANLASHVFAPSESVAEILRDRGVTSAISIVPTGVDVDHFASGDGAGFRDRHGLPESAFVVGHLGRLAPEKNLDFLTAAVARFVRREPQARFLAVGGGPSEGEIRECFERLDIPERLVMPGSLSGQELVDAYHAMDVFAFASHSETQGMVLTEAMAAGVPVVALDASGAREVVDDGKNGRLLKRQDEAAFADALGWVAGHEAETRAALHAAARQTAERFSMRRCAEKALQTYHAVCMAEMVRRPAALGFWETALQQLKAEWDLMLNVAGAAAASLESGDEEDLEDHD